MEALRRLVVMALLGVWCFPAAALAKPMPDPVGAGESRPSSVPSPAVSPRTASPQSEADAFAAREGQSPDLQDFKGGGVSIYIGSGALLVLVVVLLIILV